MVQPQFIMLTMLAKPRWININEIAHAVGDHPHAGTITLYLKNGEELAVHHKQDVAYVQLMLNSLAKLPED